MYSSHRVISGTLGLPLYHRTADLLNIDPLNTEEIFSSGIFGPSGSASITKPELIIGNDSRYESDTVEGRRHHKGASLKQKFVVFLRCYWGIELGARAGVA